jgi:hypothetical protein
VQASAVATAGTRAGFLAIPRFINLISVLVLVMENPWHSSVRQQLTGW